MAALDATPEEAATVAAPAPEPAPAAGAAAGDPSSLGLLSFIVGSVALGLALVGVVPAAAVGAPLAIILAATAAGLFLATIWAAALGQSAVATIFGIFGGFWLSYAVLVFGLLHNWFGIAATAVTSTEELFQVSWLIVMLALTLASLRLPLAFTGVFALVDLALLLLLLGTSQASAGLLKVAGYVILVFAALGIYLFTSSLAQATGGPALPLGNPVLHG
jgi:succinate-acetate transporter protein